MGNEMGNNNATGFTEEENFSTVEDPKRLLSKEITPRSVEDVNKDALNKEVAPIGKEEGGDFSPQDSQLVEDENLIELNVDEIVPGSNDQPEEQALLIKKEEDEMTNSSSPSSLSSTSSDDKEAEKLAKSEKDQREPVATIGSSVETTEQISPSICLPETEVFEDLEVRADTEAMAISAQKLAQLQNDQQKPLATIGSSTETEQITPSVCLPETEILEDREVRADTKVVVLEAEKLAQSENDQQEPATVGLPGDTEKISPLDPLPKTEFLENQEAKADTMATAAEKLAQSDNDQQESTTVGLSSETEQISPSDILPENKIFEDLEVRADIEAISADTLAQSEHDQQEPATVGLSGETEQISPSDLLPENEVLEARKVRVDSEAIAAEMLAQLEHDQQEPATIGLSGETEQILPSDLLPETDVLEDREVRADAEAVVISEKKRLNESLEEHHKEESKEEKALCADETSVIGSNNDPIDSGGKSNQEPSTEVSLIGVESWESGEEITSLANSSSSHHIHAIKEKTPETPEKMRVLNSEMSAFETDYSKSLESDSETVEQKGMVSVEIPEETRGSKSELEDSKSLESKSKIVVAPEKLWQDLKDKNAAILITQLESLPSEPKIADDDYSSEKKMVEVEPDQPLPSSLQEPKKNEETFDSNSLIKEITVSMNDLDSDKTKRFAEIPESTPPPLETKAWSRESTDSDRDSVQYAQMRKSPSFSIDLQDEARNEDSDQTPLLYQDKAEIQIVALTASDGHSDDRDRRALPVEDKVVELERSEEESLIVAEREGNEIASSSIKVTISSSSAKSREKRRKVKSSLFGTCLCCTTVIN